MTLLSLGLVALLAAQDTPVAGGALRPPPPPGLSWEDADALALTVKRIDRRLRSGRPAARETLVVTERQLNSYVNLTLASKLPPALSGLQLSLQRDRVGARGVLDLDRVKERIPEGAGAGLLGILSGAVPVELWGRLSTSEGQGQVEIQETRVAGVSLPPAVLAQIVSESTRTEKRPEGIDLLAPFPLPYAVRRVRLEPGRALFDFFQ